ncbi:MAG: DUF4209 domain-containing protein, partial [Gemmatimonadaceae bacterium]
MEASARDHPVEDIAYGRRATRIAHAKDAPRRPLGQGILGADLWEHLDSVLNSQTGPNLRNEFAHGLARPGHGSPENAGLSLSLLYLIAEVARRDSPPTLSVG